ncbi:glutamine amidotransferase-related protein [Paenibacillus sp. GM2]|uniref:CTP synthase C-terminal region-related (seleno)protein n=1 Tax=Paenibacillus sp. GM2 TaxID=1622070 RepID=UPI000839697E|nr:glutamine amidotransferase [Paenibacillus sp. GM2]
MDSIRIGIIGDYDARPSHIATNEAIRHCAAFLGLKQETQWVSTNSLESDFKEKLSTFNAFWGAPGSPYKSAQGAMNAIQFARENNFPFIGTCGGFQHVVLEFARDVFDLPEVKRPDFDPYMPNVFISGLSCSLVGETQRILLSDGTKVAQIYGLVETEERYNCSFGLSSNFADQLTSHGVVIAGTDENGDVRILEIPQNRFFVATLFQPQLSSTPESPHKLILAYLKDAEVFRLEYM